MEKHNHIKNIADNITNLRKYLYEIELGFVHHIDNQEFLDLSETHAIVVSIIEQRMDDLFKKI